MVKQNFRRPFFHLKDKSLLTFEEEEGDQQVALLPSKEEAEEEEKAEDPVVPEPVPAAEPAVEAAAPNGAEASPVARRGTRSSGRPVVAGLGQATKRKGGRL